MNLLSIFDQDLHDQNVKQLRLHYDYLMHLLKDKFADFTSNELAMIQCYAFITLEQTSRPAHTFQ